MKPYVYFSREGWICGFVNGNGETIYLARKKTQHQAEAFIAWYIQAVRSTIEAHLANVAARKEPQLAKWRIRNHMRAEKRRLAAVQPESEPRVEPDPGASGRAVAEG